jgi:hypothetical protein
MASAMALSGLFFLPAGLWMCGVPSPGASGAAVPPSLAVIQSMSELATTRVHINDFIEGENKHWHGKWSLHGEVLLGVDLTAAKYVHSDAGKREAVLRLPPPRVISSKIDHDRSDEVFMKSLSWTGFSNPNVLRDEVWKQADAKIQRLGQEPGYAERAKVQAERTLQQLFEGVKWKVRVEWGA